MKTSSEKILLVLLLIFITGAFIFSQFSLLNAKEINTVFIIPSLLFSWFLAYNYYKKSKQKKG